MPLVYILSVNAVSQGFISSEVLAAGWFTVPCANVETYFAQPRGESASCLVADESAIGECASNVRALCAARPETPVICTAQKPTLRTVVSAIKSGALEFLAQPLESKLLLATVQAALAASHSALCSNVELCTLSAQYRQLSLRERQVLNCVVAGQLNKQIAHELGISLITVKTHRGRVMKKMQAPSLPALVKMVARLDKTLEVAEIQRVNQPIVIGDDESGLPRLGTLSVNWPKSAAARLSDKAC